MTNVKMPGHLNVSNGGLMKTNVNVPPAQKFELAAGQIASALGSAVGAAAPFFPAAAVLSAALSGVGNVATTAANSGGGGVGAFGGAPGYSPMGGGMGGMSGGMGGMGGMSNMLGAGGSPYQSMMGGAGGGMGSSGGIGGLLGSILGGVGGMLGGGGSTASPGPTGNLSDPGQLLQLQLQMEQQNEMFTTMSNLLNSRHSTAQSLIQNIH